MNPDILEVNISNKNIILPGGKTNKCSSKCAYNFSYPETNLIIKNDGIQITLTFPNSTSANPVEYNYAKYNVSKAIITSPSLHKFNNAKADAELIVEHTPVNGGEKLWVCVPIKVSSTPTDFISDIIKETAKNRPSVSTEPFAYTIDFMLQQLIPVKPYYNYYGSYGPSNKGNFIVFDVINALFIDSEAFSKISGANSIITPNNIMMSIIKKSGEANPLYYNSAGPNLKRLQNEIYIDCNPTGKSANLVNVVNPKKNVSFGAGYNKSVMIFLKLIIGVFLMIFVFSCISAFLKYFAPKNPINKMLPTASNIVKSS